MRNYRKKDDDGNNPPLEIKEEIIKRLEQEIANLKDLLHNLIILKFL